MQEPLDLSSVLDYALPVALRHVPFRIRDVARELDVRAALAGGLPRDLLRLHLHHISRDEFTLVLRDFDVAVEGDGIRFAYELQRRLRGELVVNERFRTATLHTPDPLQIDITTARTEEYPEPGKLPVVDVRGATLEQDLARRDFTVNAIALELNYNFGHILDPQGGAGDIAARLLRILHPASFIDDPTRMFRALRYCLRLNYDLEPATREAFLTAVDEAVLDHLSPERIRYELECICGEERWVEMWALLDASALSGAITPLLAGLSSSWDMAGARALDIAMRNRADLLERTQLEPWVARVAWALYVLDTGRAELAATRLGLFPRHLRVLRDARAVLGCACMAALDEPVPSAIARELERCSEQAVLLAALIYQPRTEAGIAARKRLLHYLDDYSQVRCAIDAAELVQLGLRPGKELGRMRDEIRYRRMDGRITSVEDERAYVVAELANSAPPGPLELDHG